jgi:hypothetical protein
MSKKKVASTKIPSGRVSYKHDERTLKLRDIINELDKVKKIPAQHNWGNRIKPDHNWGDYGNLKLNNCTFVTAAYLLMIWKSYKEDRIYRPGVKQIVNDYSKLIKDNRKGGKSINTLLNEGGKPIEAIKVLKHWRKKGIDGHKIVAFAKLTFNHKKDQKEELKRAVYLYGGCYIGINIPRSVEKQWQQNKKWTIVPGLPRGDARRKLWFSHALLVTGYNEKELRVVTFGKEEIMTWAFYEKYVDEAYAVFDENFLKARKTPSKLKVKDLKNIVKSKIKKRTDTKAVK